MSIDFSSNVDGIKTILIGESGTGKTSLIGALAGQAFESFSMTTSSASFIDKFIEIDDTKYCLEVWDTAGQERLRSLTKIFTKDSKMVIFVYDITDKRSFDELNFWVNMIKESLGQKPVLGIVGNKKDLYELEKVDEVTARQYAEKIGARFGLTSAKDDAIGIELYMRDLLGDYIKKRGQERNNSISSGYSNKRSPRVKLNQGENVDDKKCGC